ncbi:UNVERIFIED_CONTAM: hypothetical protein K2H54_071324 [Gekko kuhli]
MEEMQGKVAAIREQMDEVSEKLNQLEVQKRSLISSNEHLMKELQKLSSQFPPLCAFTVRMAVPCITLPLCDASGGGVATVTDDKSLGNQVTAEARTGTTGVG